MSDETPSPANRPKILTIVLAGGHGSRLGPLTKGRAKPALPFGGMFRLIDTVLSNIAHSGLTDVWIVEQYEPHALNEHVAGGRPWDLDRTHGGMRILPTYEQHDDNDDPDDDLERAEGNADALVKQLRFIEDLAPDIVITTSADHLYRLDFRDVIDTHRRCEAGLTIVSTAPPADDDPTRFAWITVDGDTVTGFDDKPDDPHGDAVCTEVFVFDASTLVAELSSLHAQSDSAGDYGDHLIPNLLARSTVVHHHLDGYWRDLGTINAYHRGHMELVGERPSLVLDDHDWPILTSSVTNGAARFIGKGSAADSLVGPGSTIKGTVTNSVLGRGVTIQAGATVDRSVVLDGAVVARDVRLSWAIVDDGTHVTTSSSPAEHDAPLDPDEPIVIYSTR